MTQRIFLFDQDDRLSLLEESGYATEDDLQRLLAENPDLLAGDQISPGDPVLEAVLRELSWALEIVRGTARR